MRESIISGQFNETVLPKLTLLPMLIFYLIPRVFERSIACQHRRYVLLQIPSPVKLGTCICSNFDTNFSKHVMWRSVLYCIYM